MSPLELHPAPFPLLSATLCAPLVAAALALLAPSERSARLIAAIGAALALVCAMAVWASGDWGGSAGFQLVERRMWIPSLNVQYLLGVDGMSAMLLVTTALLGLGAQLGSWTSVAQHGRAWCALLLALESALIGLFSALDLVLFFVFWELTLPAVYFLVSLWGVGPERRFAALKYTLLMLTGGICLLFGVVLLGLAHQDLTGALAFDLPSLLAAPIPPGAQGLIFVLMFIGLSVKIPVWPLHSWLPTIAMEGPPAGLALFVGLKVGLYGLLRFAMPLLPFAAAQARGWLVGLGLLGFGVAALIALSQRNLRRQVAWLSMSHAGLLTVAVGAGGALAIQGAMVQLSNLGLVTGGLLLALGFLLQRRGSTDVEALGGLAAPAPRLAALVLGFGLASAGVPGTGGFVTEWLLLRGLAEASPVLALLGLLGGADGAAAFALAFRAAFWGPLRPGLQVPDLRPREAAVLLVGMVILLGGGLLPGPALDATAPAAELLAALLAQAR